MNIERFKGIEFVRISSMTKEQQHQVWQTFERDKIFKIVTDKSLLNDCILYNDFTAWEARQIANPANTTASKPVAFKGSLGKLAFE